MKLSSALLYFPYFFRNKKTQRFFFHFEQLGMYFNSICPSPLSTLTRASTITYSKLLEMEKENL